MDANHLNETHGFSTRASAVTVVHASEGGAVQRRFCGYIVATAVLLMLLSARAAAENLKEPIPPGGSSGNASAVAAYSRPSKLAERIAGEAKLVPQLDGHMLAASPQGVPPIVKSKDGFVGSAMAAESEFDLGRQLQSGLVGQVAPDSRTWARVAGVVGFLLLPMFAFKLCVAKYKLPLTPGEVTKAGWICMLMCLTCYFGAWGYELHWRMILVGLGTLFIGACARATAMAVSAAAVNVVAERIALLAKLKEAASKLTTD